MTASRLGLPPTIRACLFDLDGVLTDTANVHAAAWRRVFREFGFELTDDDYVRYVDGRRRTDGARTFLASRGVEVGDEELAVVVETKDLLFLESIQRDGVRRYERSIAYARAVAEAGLRRAVVSASRHCSEVLAIVGIESLFEVRVDGVVAAAEHLAGKPAPDTYLYAAGLLGVDPPACAVFEDALSGVEAGRAGSFGYIVGVARAADPAELVERGADVAVADLGDLH